LKLLVGDIESDSKTYGEIRYNRELRTPKDWTSRIGYLPQDDCYYQELTVYDNIIYYLGFNNKYSKKNLHKEAIDILKKSQIVDKKDALMSSLSGGERKRAMIALTLSSEPEVLILDEPTSGLDSGSALNIIHNLKEYALKYNRMVILTIHNPGMGIFNMIDDLFFMTPDGLFYSGPVSELSLFFDKYKLVIKANISVPEFLSAVQHNESPFREEVFKIVSENINLRSKEVSICNNIKLDLTDLDFSHIFRILLFNMKLSWSRSTIIGILMKIYSVVYLGFAYKLTNETLSIIDSTDNFSRTFLKSFYLFMHTYYNMILILNLSPGADSRNENCFKLENFTGRYSFLSHFLYLHIQKLVNLIRLLTLIFMNNLFFITSPLKHAKILFLIYLLNILYSFLIVPIYMLVYGINLSETFISTIYLLFGIIATCNPEYKLKAKVSVAESISASLPLVFNLLILFPISNLDILISKYLISNKLVKVSIDGKNYIEGPKIYEIFDLPINNTIMCLSIIISYGLMMILVWNLLKRKFLSNYRIKLKSD
jgi:ABC-type multidrug transport system ATPase subunit